MGFVTDSDDFLEDRRCFGKGQRIFSHRKVDQVLHVFSALVFCDTDCIGDNIRVLQGLDRSREMAFPSIDNKKVGKGTYLLVAQSPSQYFTHHRHVVHCRRSSDMKYAIFTLRCLEVLKNHHNAGRIFAMGVRDIVRLDSHGLSLEVQTCFECFIKLDCFGPEKVFHGKTCHVLR
ncbi:MAG: hypothetical protein A4E63_00001 [Syntrophorhabdus sp. PtaU1.Bin050]|nr:MAG: hypothetical protein A4E63_00001 [Syntrophorhabdus sp. PtaU1.Bin050]